jgi:hypothetical protein
MISWAGILSSTKLAPLVKVAEAAVEAGADVAASAVGVAVAAEAVVVAVAAVAVAVEAGTAAIAVVAVGETAAGSRLQQGMIALQPGSSR